MSDRIIGFTKAIAIFLPKHYETLKPEFKPLIGKRIELEYDGVREMGQYEGHESWLYRDDDAFGWIPEEDLSELTEVENSKETGQ